MLGVVRSGTGRRFGALALGLGRRPRARRVARWSHAHPQRAAPFHLEEATIDSIHGALRAGQLTCRGLVQLYLDRIAAYNHDEHDLNAVQTVNPAALDEAARLDVQRAAGVMAGPLHCIPVLVKDQVETSDMPTTYGSALFRDFVPERNATVVERLKAAGAIILAKTTMGEFAASYAGSSFGICRNAYDPARSPAARPAAPASAWPRTSAPWGSARTRSARSAIPPRGPVSSACGRPFRSSAGSA